MQLSVQQRYRIEKARALRLLARAKKPKPGKTEIELWPEKDESRDAFMDRCVIALSKCVGPKKAPGVCARKWRKSEKLGKKELVTRAAIVAEADADLLIEPCGASCLACEGRNAPWQIRFDESEHPRDEHGRWTDSGSSDAPKTTRGKGASSEAFAKIEAAVAAIPASHAAQIAHVPVVLTKTSDDFPSHIAAGGGASTVGLFSWINDQPRIDVAEAIKMQATITEVGPQGSAQSHKTESLLPVRQPEQVTVHELAHAFDYVNGWAPSADVGLKQSFADAVKQMTEQEAKNANYWIRGGQREMFAELYSQVYNPNHSDDQTFFGGLTWARTEQLFAPAIAHVLQIKQFDIVRRAAPAEPTDVKTGWFVNEGGELYALLNGMPYEVDVSGTPFAGLRLVPGEYADADALVAAATLQKQWSLARASARVLLARGTWNEADHPRVPAGSGDDSGQFAPGGGGGGSGSSSTKPSKPGKSKKPAKKEDFDKAKINIRKAGGAATTQSEQEFIAKWNEKIGIEPEEFKKTFLGGVNASMNIVDYGGKYNVTGSIWGTGANEGAEVGTYERDIKIDAKEAYSAYFKLNKSQTKHDIGKKILAGNVEMYEALGIEKVEVSANIDVGGYAWAKYGYVPTQAAWNELRGKLENKLGGGGSSSRPSSGADTYEAEEWSMLGDDVQSDVRDRWMRESYSEFLESEQQQWRENGQAKDDAKHQLASLYNDSDMPEWATEAFDGARNYFEERGQPPIPYTNKQLFDAITLDYESRNGDGEDDPEITFHDDKLQEPEGYDPAQGTLPGIDPIDPASYLTQDMRDRIEKRMIAAFDKKAEENADDIDPPDYLAESVSEYQGEYWDQKEDSDKLRHAIDYGMADIEIEPDEDDEEADEDEDDGLGLNPDLFPPEKPGEDPLLAAVKSSNPKSIWKIADSARGKELLLNTNWSGVLKLTDAESMARFKEYVGRAARG